MIIQMTRIPRLQLPIPRSRLRHWKYSSGNACQPPRRSWLNQELPSEKWRESQPQSTDWLWWSRDSRAKRSPPCSCQPPNGYGKEMNCFSSSSSYLCEFRSTDGDDDSFFRFILTVELASSEKSHRLLLISFFGIQKYGGLMDR